MSVRVYGGEPIEEAIKNKVDDYFAMILDAVKTMEEEGNLKIEKID